VEREVEALDGIAHGKKDRIVRDCMGGDGSCANGAPLGQPRIQAAAALLAGQGFVVGQIVGLAHEGVDGADGVAARAGKRDKGVVEVLRLPPGDGAANSVGPVQSGSALRRFLRCESLAQAAVLQI
jgi:hypothetical protein